MIDRAIWAAIMHSCSSRCGHPVKFIMGSNVCVLSAPMSMFMLLHDVVDVTRAPFYLKSLLLGMVLLRGTASPNTAEAQAHSYSWERV